MYRSTAATGTYSPSLPQLLQQFLGTIATTHGQVGIDQPIGTLATFSALGGVVVKDQLALGVASDTVDVVSVGDEVGIDVGPAEA